MLIAAVFTISKTWKQPKCPLTDEWTKKIWYMYTTGYYSDVKRRMHTVKGFVIVNKAEDSAIWAGFSWAAFGWSPLNDKAVITWHLNWS